MAISLVLAPVVVASGGTANFGSTANRVAFVFQETGSATPVAPTIGGVSMTQAGTSSNRGGTNPSGYMWYLINPGSGSQTVTDASGGTSVYFCVDGADQTNPVETTVQINSGGQVMNFTTGSLADANCWAFAGADSALGNSITPSGILTTKGLAGFAAVTAYSNVPFGSGIQTGTLTWDIATTTFGNMVVIKPAAAVAATATPLPQLMTLGVG